MTLWTRWAGGVELQEPELLAEHLEGPILETLSEGLQTLVEEARRELSVRESEWRSVLPRLAAWLDRARQARTADDQVKRLKLAEAWLKEASVALQNDKFAPIADKAIGHWETLRQDSNVELGRIILSGTGKDKQRRVELDARIDGVPGAALGVMSQGELNALALSLFLPGATLPESPFRFVVIDDPVQSMDPARVDGLARTLELAAKSRQVIVFTHDARLSPSSV